MVNQPNPPDIDLDTQDRNRSYRRGASPDLSQQSGPLSSEDDIKRDEDSDKDLWKSNETFDDYLKKKKEELEKNRKERYFKQRDTFKEKQRQTRQESRPRSPEPERPITPLEYVDEPAQDQMMNENLQWM